MDFETITGAKWIWADDSGRKNDWCYLEKEFTLKSVPKSAVAKIAVDSKYYLLVNNRLAVFEGGLNRESVPGCGYADSFELAPYLKLGENRIVALCWFWGNGGRNNVSGTKAGFLFRCDALDLVSDGEWRAKRSAANYQTDGENPAGIFGGYNIGYDANKEDVSFLNLGKPLADWRRAEVVGSVPDSPWGNLVRRPVPMTKYSEVRPYESVRPAGEVHACHLPYAMQLTPYFSVFAEGGEVIDVRTDRYYINGGPGDEHHWFRGQRAEYVCKPGLNTFEALNWLFGENVLYTIPRSVKVLRLGYRESGYDCEIAGYFRCENETVNRIAAKSARTLYACMRDNFMDCPDRERGQWIGDVSVQIPQVFYVLTDRAADLVKKSIRDFISFREDGRLKGNIPGDCPYELPSQSLNAISCIGMISSYYDATGDKETLSFVFRPVVEYLQLWETDKNGLVPRFGNDMWFDHLLNKDAKLLEAEWYYGALKFAKKMSGILKRPEYDAFLQDRMNLLERVFPSFYDGKSYRSGKVIHNNDQFLHRESEQFVPDERANALGVLVGLIPEAHYEQVKNVLTAVYQASPYMEAYVLEALFAMGYCEEAFARMERRYSQFAYNENSTLWEDFHILGTRNHAWSGGPLTCLFRYAAGITLSERRRKAEICPDTRVLKCVACGVPSGKGLLELEVFEKNGTWKLVLKNPEQVKCRIVLKPERIGKQYFEGGETEKRFESNAAYFECALTETGSESK